MRCEASLKLGVPCCGLFLVSPKSLVVYFEVHLSLPVHFMAFLDISSALERSQILDHRLGTIVVVAPSPVPALYFYGASCSVLPSLVGSRRSCLSYCNMNVIVELSILYIELYRGAYLLRQLIVQQHRCSVTPRGTRVHSVLPTVRYGTVVVRKNEQNA